MIPTGARRAALRGNVARYIPQLPDPPNPLAAHVFSVSPEFPTAVKGMPVRYVLTRTKYALASGETISVALTDNVPTAFVNSLTVDIDAAISGKTGVTRSGNTLIFDWRGPRCLKIKRATSQNFSVVSEVATLSLSSASGGVISPLGTTASITIADQTKGHPWWQSPRAGSTPGPLRFSPLIDGTNSLRASATSNTVEWAGVGTPDTSKFSFAFGLFLTDHDISTPNLWLANTAKNNIKLLRSAGALSIPNVIIKSATSSTNILSVIGTAGLRLNQHHRVFGSIDWTKDTLAAGLQLWLDDTNIAPTTGTWAGNSTTPPVMAIASARSGFTLMSGGGTADDVAGDLSFFWAVAGQAVDFSTQAMRDKFWADTLDDTSGANPSGFRGGAPLGGGTARPNIYLFGNKADWTASPPTNSYGLGDPQVRVSTTATGTGFIPANYISDIDVGIPSARKIYASAVDNDSPYTIGSSTGLPQGSNIQNTFNGIDVSAWKFSFEDEFSRPVPTDPSQPGYFNKGDITAGGTMPWETVFQQFRDQSAAYNLRCNGPAAMHSLYIDAGGTYMRPEAYVSGSTSNPNTDPVSGGWLPGVCEGLEFLADPNGVVTLRAGSIPAILKPEITKNDPNGKPFVFYSQMLTTDGRGPMPAGGGTNMLFGMDVGLIEWRVRFARPVFPLTPLGHFPAIWSRRSPNGAGGSTNPFESDLVELLGHSRRTWTTTNILYTNDGTNTATTNKVNRNVHELTQGPAWGPWMVLQELTTLDSPAGSAQQSYFRDGTLISATGSQFGTIDQLNPAPNSQSLGPLQGGMRHLLATLQVDGGYNIPNTPDNTTDFENCMMQIDYVRVRQPIGAKFIRKGSALTTVSSSTTVNTL